MAESRSLHSHALPNYDKAELPQNKIESYILNPFHDEGKHKARLFESILGFKQSDWEELRRRILDELPYNEARLGEAGAWGQKYVVVLPILGLNSNTANVRTVWIIRPTTDHPSFVTALVEKGGL
jgi:hypothetical protein